MRRQLTAARLTTAILFILIFAMAVRTPVDTDTWWHLRSGAWQVEHRAVLGEDVFSHTRTGAPWINHSWGAQVVLWLIYSAFGGHGTPGDIIVTGDESGMPGEPKVLTGDPGSVGLALYTALLATAGMALIYLASPGSVYVRAFALILGAATAAVFWSPRPQMFTFFLSALVYYLLSRYKDDQGDRLWWIPVIVWVWGNLHGGFAIAFILMAGFIGGEIAGNLFNPGGEGVIPWRGIGRIALVMVVSAAVLVINPFGLQIYRVPFEITGIGVLQNFIQEWSAPNFHERQTWPFIFLLLGSLGFAGLSRRRLDWTDLVLVAGTAFLALQAGRNIALFALVATPVLARHVDAFLEERGWQLRPATRTSPGLARLNWLLLALIVLGAAGKVWYALEPHMVAQAQADALPVRVSEYINEARPAGLMFNSYNWGGYLMFAAPDFPVFVDGRTELYGDDFLTDHLRVTYLQSGWRDTLAAYDVSWVVVETGSALANVLREEPGWRVAYEDEQAVLLERTMP